MVEFERNTATIHSHIIVITSWYDGAKKTWHANSPQYARSLPVLEAGRKGHPSREAAVAELTRQLAEYLENKPARSGGPRRQ